MSSFHQITIVGYCGREPEMRQTPSGVAICNVSVATTEVWKDKGGGKQERTTWFRVAFFDRLAEVANEYLHKGSLILVTGTVGVSAYKNRDGEAAASLEVRARELKMLGGKGQGGEEGAPTQTSQKSTGAAGARAAAGGKPASAAQAPQQQSLPQEEEVFDENIPF